MRGREREREGEGERERGGEIERSREWKYIFYVVTWAHNIYGGTIVW